ncbi:MAG: DUF2334 domain-containing protein [Chrysiogenales bacterium]|nr:MAG: DUF2334 domain-containing protein [Chrysiogenales bacterium]
MKVRESLTLLIVPCWRNEETIDRASTILALIHPLPGERILHGYSHCRPDSIWNRLRFGTDHHGEFERLNVREARARLTLGLSAFERAGLPRPRLFCAPRWLQNRATAAALFELGFEGFMDRKGYRTREGSWYAIPAVSFDAGRRAWMKSLHILVIKSYISFLMMTGRCFRLALHPSDMEDKRVVRLLTELFSRLEREGWRPAAIGEIMNL